MNNSGHKLTVVVRVKISASKFNDFCFVAGFGGAIPLANNNPRSNFPPSEQTHRLRSSMSVSAVSASRQRRGVKASKRRVFSCRSFGEELRESVMRLPPFLHCSFLHLSQRQNPRLLRRLCNYRYRRWYFTLSPANVSKYRTSWAHALRLLGLGIGWRRILGWAL